MDSSKVGARKEAGSNPQLAYLTKIDTGTYFRLVRLSIQDGKGPLPMKSIQTIHTNGIHSKNMKIPRKQYR
jgi:hypothetical protein